MAWNINELRNPALRKFFGKIFGDSEATAAEKINIEYDSDTTGIGKIEMGTSSVPQVLNTNPGAAVIADSTNILHSAGAGDCDDLIASYKKVAVSGDGDAGITVVGGAQRAYVGTTGGTTVADECYGDQPWAKHEGTGAVTAISGLSALLNVGEDNFTATTANAGHFHVRGDADVTGTYDGVAIEAYGDVDTLDSMLHLMSDSGASVQTAIKTTGDFADSFMEIDGASTGVVVAAGSGLTHDPNAVTSDAYLVVKLGSTKYALPLYQI
jgi:hypothetical protein